MVDKEETNKNFRQQLMRKILPLSEMNQDSMTSKVRSLKLMKL